MNVLFKNTRKVVVLLQNSWQVKLILKSLELFLFFSFFFFLRMKPASLINQKRLNQVEQHEERLVVYHWNYDLYCRFQVH